MAREVDAGRLGPLDRRDQVVERPQLGRGQRAVPGQGQGDPVALFLVIQAAALGRGDIDHQREGLGRRPQDGQRPDLPRVGADQVDHPVADQEPAVVMDQLPGERRAVPPRHCGS